MCVLHQNQWMLCELTPVQQFVRADQPKQRQGGTAADNQTTVLHVALHVAVVALCRSPSFSELACLCAVAHPPPPRQVLRKGDVLMEFDGVPIANDGTVPFRARERVFFTAFTTLKPTGSTARVKVRVLHMLGFGVWGCRGDQLTQLVPRQLSIVV